MEIKILITNKEQTEKKIQHKLYRLTTYMETFTDSIANQMEEICLYKYMYRIRKL